MIVEGDTDACFIVWDWNPNTVATHDFDFSDDVDDEVRMMIDVAVDWETGMPISKVRSREQYSFVEKLNYRCTPRMKDVTKVAFNFVSRRLRR